MSSAALANAVEPIYVRMHLVKGLLDTMPSGPSEEVPLTTPIVKSAVETIAKDDMFSKIPSNKVKRIVSAFVGSPRHTWRDIIPILVNDLRTFYTLTTNEDLRHFMYKSFLHMWIEISYRQAFTEEALKRGAISLTLEETNRRDFNAAGVELIAESITSLMNGVNRDPAVFNEVMLGMPWLLLMADTRNSLRQRMLAITTLKRVMYTVAEPDRIMSEANIQLYDVIIKLGLYEKNKELRDHVLQIIEVLTEANPDLMKSRIIHELRTKPMSPSMRSTSPRFSQPPKHMP